MRALLRSALDAILPRRCEVCRAGVVSRDGRALCSTCWSRVPRIEGPRCPVCGIPFRSDAALSQSPTHRCGDCHDSPPAFTRAVSAGLYEGVLAEAIRRYKYHRRVGLTPTFGELLAPTLEALPVVDAVLPVPLHPRRLRTREFNQSLLLAAWVSRRLQRPLWPDALRRIRWTDPQIGLDRNRRLTNVRHAFAVRHPEQVSGRRLLVVDDVLTTGATVNECARVLCAAEAEAVFIVTLARMP
ncbi:MAG: ComF family protein [Nitrospiria bacterium]